MDIKTASDMTEKDSTHASGSFDPEALIDSLSQEEIDRIEALSQGRDDDSGDTGLQDGVPETTKDDENGPAEMPQKKIVWQTPDSDADKKLRSESYKLLANVGNFGLFLLLAVLFGYVIGQGCDTLFGTKPFFTVFWVVCAVAATVREVVKTIKAAKKLGEEDTEQK